ncbi:MAG: HNH endonuclease signature motif containing protein [Actinomycetota bacterium]
MAADPYGRSTRRYRQVRAGYRAWAEAQQLPCWICGHPIDYRLRRGRWAWTLDHATPLAHGGPLLAPSNHRSAHARCNSQRGARPRRPPVRRERLRTSRRW